MIITLTIDNETYNVLQCRYVFRRDVDTKGLPRGGMKGGDIYVAMESTQNNLLFEEYVRKDGPKPVSGSLDFFDTHKEASIRTIEFEEAYVYALGEHMVRHSHLPMTQALAISPLRLDINGTVRMDRRFPQTYAFWWEEYKPEKEAIPLKVWNPTAKSKIASIGLLEGDEEVTDKNEVVQYVNIQNNPDKHVDGRIVTHTDRLGQKLRCKVKFEKEGTYSFKVKLQPDSGNSSYSQSEKERNKNFEYCMEEKEFTTDGNGEKIIELSDNLFVSPAGGDLFSIVAIDANGNTVTANAKVRTRRILYYVEIVPAILRITPSTWKNPFENEYDAHGIEFKKLATMEVNFPNEIFCKDMDETDFNKKIREMYNSSVVKDMEPYCFALAFIGQNVRMETQILTAIVDVDGNKTDTLIKTDINTFLWIGVDNTDWFVKGFCKNLNSGEKVPVSEEMCLPNMLTSYENSFLYDSIKIDTSILDNGKWKFEIEINIISSFCTGYANRNFQVISTNCLGNTPRDTDELSQTIMHETGHLIGMACNASGKLPDKTPDYYYFSGNHCKKPATCLMYHILNKCTNFCNDCAITVKKVDLKDGIKY